MPLSLTKLQSLLFKKGFLVKKYFSIDNFCVFIELYAVKTSELFFLYIPSKYDFDCSHEQENYKIKDLDINISATTNDEYATANDGLIEKYRNYMINITPEDGKVLQELENNYKQNINLKDISDEDFTAIKSIYRQLRRLKYCVENIKYKIAILYKNFLCCIRRDDSISCFAIKKYEGSPIKKLYIISDLETLYEGSGSLEQNIYTIKNSLCSILERNQNNHIDVILKILSNKKDIINIPKQTDRKKREYDIMINDIQVLLNDIIKKEDAINYQIQSLENTYTNNLQSDISKIHQKNNLEKELDILLNTKSELVQDLNIIKNKKEHSLLSIDKIMFDNAVMFDCIVQNFNKLKEFC